MIIVIIVIKVSLNETGCCNIKHAIYTHTYARARYMYIIYKHNKSNVWRKEYYLLCYITLIETFFVAEWK